MTLRNLDPFSLKQPTIHFETLRGPEVPGFPAALKEGEVRSPHPLSLSNRIGVHQRTVLPRSCKYPRNNSPLPETEVETEVEVEAEVEAEVEVEAEKKAEHQALDEALAKARHSSS